MTRGWQTATLWLGAAAFIAALYPYSRAHDCQHWHDGTFLVLSAVAAVLAGVGTYRALSKGNKTAAILLGTAATVVFVMVAVTIAYAGVASSCTR